MQALPARIGRYELLRVLGAGGMGVVYEAVLHGPAGFKKWVAVKVLRPGAVDDRLRAALIREARVGALLQHPNVVSTHELGQADGQWFLAMDLVRGSRLDRVTSGPLPGSALLDAAIQTCAGLAHVHDLEVDGRRLGLVHRDLKPSNLLVDKDGLVRITDFGVASLASAIGDTSGTRGYSPPEQVAGRAEQRSDLFALGVTLYALAAGRSPFSESTDASAAAIEHRTAAPDFFAPLDERVRGLGAVVRRCLRADPKERWPSAAALEAALVDLRPRAPGPSMRDVVRGTTGRAALAAAASQPTTPPAGNTIVTVLRPKGNLPAAPDAYFGREAELRDVTTRLAGGSRLVTLLGPGGMGKTRLALEVARARADLSGGTWFVDLSEATTVAQLAAAVARAFGAKLDGDDPAGQVADTLRDRGPTLLVLDNYEQAVEHAPATVGRWRDRAPSTRMLVTSRIALRLQGEELVALDPLDATAAVDLFLARAPVRPPETDLPLVKELVERLDRHPLAIELAAARTRALPVRGLLKNLEQRFRLLAQGGPERPERHRSLRASLDGSFELLPAYARTSLAQLSVFAEGFTAEAAEAVVDLAGDPDAPWVIDALGVLADHSLVRLDPANGRFRMLALVQAYAAEQLPADQRRAAEARHAAYFAQLGAPAAVADERGPPDVDELGNLVAACRRALAARAPEGRPLAIAAWAILSRTGPYALGLELLDGAAGLGEDGRLVLPLADALMLTGRLDRASDVLGQALAHSRAQRNQDAIGALAGALATVAENRGRAEEAIALLQEALAALGSIGARSGVPSLEGRLGIALRVAGRMDEARAAYERAIDGHRAAGDRKGEASALGNLGYLHLVQGRLDDAIRCLGDAVTGLRETRERRMEAIQLGNLAFALLSKGDPAAAETALRDAAEILRQLGERRFEAVQVRNLGGLLQRQGRLREAGACFARALPVFREAGDRRNLGITLAILGTWEALCGRRREAQAAWDEGYALLAEVGDRRELGANLGRRAAVRVLLGEAAEAMADAEEAIEHAHALGDAATELAARIVRADALRAAGRRADAHAALDELRTRGDGPEQRLVRGLLLLADGHAEAAHGELALAHERLRPQVDVVVRIRLLVALGRLDEARTLVNTAGVGPESPFARLIPP